MEIDEDLRSLSRTVAEIEDAALVVHERLPVDDRLDQIRDGLRRRRTTRTWRRRGRLGLGIGLAVGAIVAIVLLWGRGRPLDLTVGQPPAPGIAGALVSAPSTATVPLDFSDGTRMLLSAGAQGRVLGVSPHGARVALERGTVSVDVAPRPASDWSVTTGPFVIHTTDGTFDAAWDPDGQWLDVVMRGGTARIRASCLKSEVTLTDDQSTTLSCVPGRWTSGAPVTARGRSAGVGGQSDRPRK